MTPRLRLLVDEGCPNAVGEAFEAAGHEVIYGNRSLLRGLADPQVSQEARLNAAILVACDKDMKRIARENGFVGARFKDLSLIRFCCRGPQAGHRARDAMSLIEHEWRFAEGKAARRLFIEVDDQVIRSYR